MRREFGPEPDAGRGVIAGLFTRGHWIAIGFLQLALHALGFVLAIAVQRLLWNRMSMI